MDEPRPGEPRILGRYALYDEIATGGMASVHLGRLLGPVGFSRTVAIKRLHPQFARDPEFVSMFLDEARLAARIRHPNVVSTLDIIALEGELLVVMDYVQGESLSRLLRVARQSGTRIPLRIVVSIITEMLSGLHAAHEAKSERGEPLGIVHRDVSPQNVLVGTDGVARVVDFGVAKAVGRIQVTRDGQIKGKLPYMAPEQVTSQPVDRRTDVYAASVVLWEALAGKRLFDGSDAELMYKVLEGKIVPPSHAAPGVPAEFDAIVMRGLARDPARRFPAASTMVEAIEKVAMPSTAREVGKWVEQAARDVLAARAAKVAEVESSSYVGLNVPAELAARSQPAISQVRDEPQTLSSASVSANKLLPPKAKLPLWPIAIGAVLGLLVIPAVILLTLKRGSPTAPAGAAPSVQTVASAAPSASAASQPLPPADSVASTAPPAASVSPASPEVAPTVAAVPPSGGKAKIAAQPPASTAKPPGKTTPTGKRNDDFGF